MKRLLESILVVLGIKRRAGTVAIVPARIGSSRLPGKVLLPINGKPILWHVAQVCKKAGFKDKNFMVAVDYGSTKDAMTKHGIQSVLTNPFHASGTDRVLEACIKMGLTDDTIVLNIQGDEPELDPCLVKQLAYAAEAGDADIYTMRTVITDVSDVSNINVVKVITGVNGRALLFTRGQAPFIRNTVDGYNNYRHVGIYAYTVKTLKKFSKLPPSTLEKTEGLEQLRALENGMSIKVITAAIEPKHGIDTQQDYDDAVLRMGKRHAD